MREGRPADGKRLGGILQNLEQEIAGIVLRRIPGARRVVAARLEIAQFPMAPEESLRLRVFVDRSVVEVFVNGIQCLAVRVYPEREDSIGVSMRAQGSECELRSLDVWQMDGIY